MKVISVEFLIPQDVEDDLTRLTQAFRAHEYNGKKPFAEWTEEDVFRSVMEYGQNVYIREKLWESMYYHMKCITDQEYRLRKLYRQREICKTVGLSTPEIDKEIEQLEGIQS